MNPLREFLYFTKSQLRGVLALLMLILIAAIAPRVYNWFYPPGFADGKDFTEDVVAFQKKIDAAKLHDSLQKIEVPEFNPYAENNFSTQKKYSSKTVMLFHFNPNTIGVEEWKKLGMSKKQAEAIERAKAKGFKFRKPEDIAKIYVIGEDGYERLKSYVVIPEEKREFTQQKAEPKEEKKAFVKPLINLNLADTTELVKLNGIGPSYARRIYKYRMLLGGFYEIAQLREVWNLPDSIIQKIEPFVTINPNDIATLSINNDEVETVGKHPYIKFTAARLLVAYREQHGKFTTIETSKRAMMQNDSMFNKVKPYLRLE